MTFPRALAVFFFATTLSAGAAGKAPIPIADVKRSEPVNFERDVLPFLSDNCLACHCKTTSKGGLNLETPDLMLKGGDNGPAIVPTKGGESLALQAAAHLDDDLAMPPRDNKAKAKNLTPEQLGLLKLWIDQGAKVSPRTERKVEWQPLAESLRAIFAVAITPDGQFAACARENRIFIYHLPSGRCVADEAGHRDQVNALAWSPDGALLASGGYRDVKLWRRADARKLSLADAGSRAAVSPDGKWLAVGSDDGAVKLWSLPDGQPARALEFAHAEIPADPKTSHAVVALRFSPDSTKLACAGTDKSVSIWNPVNGQTLAKAEAPGEIAALAWTADGAELVTGGSDNIVRLWSAALTPVKELKAHTGPITAVEAFSPNRIVSGSADGSLRVWEMGKDQPIAQMNHGAPIAAVAVRPDGQRFASAGADHAVKLWAADGKPVAELRGNRYVREAADERDRALQVAAGTVAYRKETADNAAKQLQAAQDRVKKSSEAIAPKQQELQAKEKALADAKAAKTVVEQALALAETELKTADDKLAAADAAAAQAKAAAAALKTVKPPAPVVPEKAADSVPADQAAADKIAADKAAAVKAAAEQVAADKALLDKALADAGAGAQDAAKAKSERDQRDAQRKQAAAKIDPAAKQLADADEAVEKAKTARAVAETELQLAKGEEQKMTGALDEAKTATAAAEAAQKKADDELKSALKAATDAEQPLRTVAFSPDNLTVAAAGDDHFIHTWNAENGAPFDVLKGHAAPVSSLAFSPSGDLVSAATDGSAIVWNLKPVWKLERTIGSPDGKSPLTDRVNALAFSHDGKLLATGSGEPSRGGEIKLWNPLDGSLVRDLHDIHTDAVFGLEFSPDDKYLASGAADKMARVVDLATGKVVRSFEGHTHHVLAVAWSLDGRTLATAGADNIVKVWDFTNGERKKNIEGYDKEVTAVRFAGATGNLVTSSGDNKVRLVALDGREIRIFPEVADFMQSAAVSADGKVIVAGGQDGILRVWNAADGGKIAAFAPPKP
jgi:WD40 repeat protein